MTSTYRLISMLLALCCDVGLTVTAVLAPNRAAFSSHDDAIRRSCYLAFGAVAAFAIPFLFDRIIMDEQPNGDKSRSTSGFMFAVYVFFLFAAIAPLVTVRFAGEGIAIKVCAAGCLLLNLISASAATIITAVPTAKKR